MTTAYTSLLGLALPVTGELSGTWGDTVNTAITSLLDTAVAGTTSITTDSDITLTTTTGASNQARQAIILWNPASGTTTRYITAPAQSKMYTVINASGGTQSIVIRGVGPTTGVTIIKGESALVAWNGSDFVKVSSVGGSATLIDLTVTGNTILGDAAADTLTVNATSTFASPVNFQGQVKLPSTGRSAAAALTPTNPAFLYGVASTYTDTTSSGTLSPVASFYGLAQPTLSTSNVTTYTTAATLYIANAPAAGGSATITNPYALYIAAGNMYLGGGTANGVMYLDGSKNVTTGSVLSFDGTNFKNINTVDLYSFVQKTGTAYMQTGVDSVGYLATDGAMTFRQGGNVIANELMRLNTTGLGIFTNSPIAPLDVFSNATATTPAARFYINRNGGTPGSVQGFAVYNNVSGGLVDTTLVAGNTANTYMAFGIHNGTSYAEGMRLTSGDGLTVVKNLFAGSGATSASYTRLWNASGYSYFGVESSAGGSIATGTSAYSAVIASAGSQSIQFAPGGTVRANMFPSGDFTIGGTTAPGGRLSVVTSEAKTSASTPMCFATSTGGGNDFQMLIARSAAGSGAFYSLQVVEQGIGYRDLALQKDGGNVGISTTIPGYSLQIGSLGTGLQRTMYIPAYFNWDGFYAQVGTSAGRGAAAIFASHTNVSNSTAYKFLADNDSVARQLQLQYAADATSLAGASFSTKFWFDGASASPGIGIGKAPSYPLDVAGTINGTGLQMVGVGADFLLRRVEGTAYPVAQLMQKSRGTPSSPATVQNGDGLGVIYFQPFVASSGYIFPASIQGKVNGAVTSTAAPTDIIMSTGTTGEVEAVRITSGQFVGIRASAPTNMLDVSGTIGKDYTSNVNVPANNTATIVVDAFNGNNFSNWVAAQFYGVGNNRWSGIISVEWDTGGSASAASFSISKHSGFNGVNITQLSATNYNGATTTDGSYIYIRNAGGVSLTPVFTFIMLASA